MLNIFKVITVSFLLKSLIKGIPVSAFKILILAFMNFEEKKNNTKIRKYFSLLRDYIYI